MHTNHRFAFIRTLLAAIMLLSVSILSARQLTPEEVFFKAIGAEEVQSVMSVGAAPLDWKKVSVLHTCRLGDINALYVMKAADADKVMIVSADDVGRPLLGWFDAGTGFDAADINPTLQWWLDVYAGEIAAAVEVGAEVYSESAASSDLKDVAPMITTRWNQGAPYNNLCPTIDGRATYTGCVATAMAQIVNFHRWPEQCRGLVKYYWSNGADTLRLDLSTIVPDWDNMADIYDSSSTTAQQQAVAELMKACGYASYMSYGTSGSGAASFNMYMALVNNFGYSNSIQYLERDCYLLGEWVGILYNELINSRPVYYAGRDTGGHAFVVDGFRSPDYFHINWGWGGMSDGYFVITALDPSSQGIGGSSSGYNYDQEAVIGIFKDYIGAEAPASLCLIGDFGTSSESYSRTGYVRFLDGSYIRNNGHSQISLRDGIRLTEIDNDNVLALFSSGSSYTIGAGYTVSASHSISSSQFPESGKYLVEPIVKVGDEIIALRTRVGACKALMLDADGDDLKFTRITNNASVRAVDLRSLSRIYQGKSLSLQATVEGLIGEYYSTITPKIYQGTSLLVEGASMLVDIPAGTSRQVGWMVDISDLPVGQYQVYITDDANNNIGGLLGIEVNVVPEGTPNLSLIAVHCDAISGDGTWSAPWIIPANHITLTSVVTNSAGLYDDYITAFIFPSAGGYSLTYLGRPIITLGPDESYQWIADVDLSVLQPGSTYFIRFYWVNNGTQTALGDYYYITASDYASIDDLSADAITLAVDPAASTVTISDPTGIVISAAAYSMAGVELEAVSRQAMAETSLSFRLPRGVALLNIRLSSGNTLLRKLGIP